MNCCGLLSRDTFDMGLIYAPDFFMKLMKQGKKGNTRNLYANNQANIQSK